MANLIGRTVARLFGLGDVLGSIPTEDEICALIERAYPLEGNRPAATTTEES